MPSPFPGMDPYLEVPAVWSDFHLTLIVTMRAELNKRLPDRYFAAADRHVRVEETEAETQIVLGKPDVYVTEENEPEKSPPAGSVTMVAAPRTVILPLRERKGKPYLRIVDYRNKRLVTAIELLSPGNKTPGPSRDAYLAKRDDYPAAGVNLVEIDLLRGGERLPLGRRKLPLFDYYLLTCRAVELPCAGFWPMTVRDAFPPMRVPLDPGEDVELPIRACLDRAYDEGRYAREIDYTEAPVSPLRKADVAWARKLVSNKTR
jgi:Protein of unknown function (DUF4058)